jgi:hypothetical protein
MIVPGRLCRLKRDQERAKGAGPDGAGVLGLLTPMSELSRLLEARAQTAQELQRLSAMLTDTSVELLTLSLILQHERAIPRPWWAWWRR